MKSKFEKICIGVIAVSAVGLVVCTIAMKRGAIL